MRAEEKETNEMKNKYLFFRLNYWQTEGSAHNLTGASHENFYRN